MFLERCGKFFFQQMSPLFFLLLLFFPLLSSLAYVFFQNMDQQALEQSFTIAIQKGKLAMDRKAKKERFLQHHSLSDPYFLDQQIESLLFLQKEKDDLESLLNHPALSRKDVFRERLSFLASPENRLSFTEENIQISSHIKETEEKQRHPVQLDEEDLQKLLALIEDVPIGNYLPPNHPPQLLIRDFRLRKMDTPLKTSLFEVEMDLLKREFIKP